MVTPRRVWPLLWILLEFWLYTSVPLLAELEWRNGWRPGGYKKAVGVFSGCFLLRGLKVVSIQVSGE